MLSKSILKKAVGNISEMSFDMGEGLAEKPSSFETFIQIIKGSAEIIIEGQSHLLQTGEGIVIPAFALNIVKANEQFTMILTNIRKAHE